PRPAHSLPPRRSSDLPGHDAEDAAGKIKRERVAAHFESRYDRQRALGELFGPAFEDSRRDGIAVLRRMLHDWPERGDVHAGQLADRKSTRLNSSHRTI